MGRNLTVWPDSAIARTAYMIETRIRDIEKFNRFLNGASIPEWKDVPRETVIKARQHTRDCLDDLLSYDTIRQIEHEFQQIRKEYILKDEHDIR